MTYNKRIHWHAFGGHDPRRSASSGETQMKRRRLLLLVTASVITLGVIACLIIQRPLMQQPPFSFIPRSDDLIKIWILF